MTKNKIIKPTKIIGSDAEAVTVVLLVNLGSPEELSVSAIAKFLSLFLSDKRVINLPKWLWYPILYGIILPFRSRKLLSQYKSLWSLSGIDGSPLLYYTQQIAQNLQLTLNHEPVNSSRSSIVEYAFCYTNPLINDTLVKIHAKYNVQELLVIPLYPQFSSTTTSPVFDQVAKFYSNKKYLPNFKFNRTFVNNPIYIDAICKTITDSWQKNGTRGQILLFSYHGLPKSIIADGDAYYDECMQTTELIVAKLSLSSSEYVVGFQSRFGANKWLTPATTDLLCDLASQRNIQSVDVICPGFICDCLETLEEIAVLNKEIFLDKGGRSFNYIPCLNNNMDVTQTLYNIIQNM
jgi:ferrochelatase